MSLLTHFTGTSLTPDQRTALDQLETFITGVEAPIFVLRGYAGTGKTFLMQGVAAWLQAQQKAVFFAAPTNRAAKVLQHRTGTEVQTLHRLLYAYKDGKFLLNARPEYFGEAPVLIVDEASLLGDFTGKEAELSFGSGRLLSDLLAFLRLDRYPATRLIFVGDPAQLPPVGMRRSPALDVHGLQKQTGLTVLEAELTNVVRQQADNGILRLAHAMRGAIEERHFEPRLPLERNEHVRLANGPLLLEQYFKASPDKPSGRQIILAHTNEAIAAYNQAVRERYFPEGKDRIMDGEFLLVTNNVYGLDVPLTNGDIVQVVQTGALEKREVRIPLGKFKPVPSAFLEFTETHVIGRFHFRDARVAVRNADGKACVLNVKLLENCLFGEEQTLPFVATFLLRSIAYNRFYQENSALYRQDQQRFKLLRAQYVLTDLYANALCARFGYAITCHKAQGGEWDQVFVDMCASMTRSTSDFYRWSYTAVTRARQKVYLRLNPHGPRPEPAGAARPKPFSAKHNPKR